MISNNPLSDIVTHNTGKWYSLVDSLIYLFTLVIFIAYKAAKKKKKRKGKKQGSSLTESNDNIVSSTTTTTDTPFSPDEQEIEESVEDTGKNEETTSHSQSVITTEIVTGKNNK
jgi:hypothetical protein